MAHAGIDVYGEEPEVRLVPNTNEIEIRVGLVYFRTLPASATELVRQLEDVIALAAARKAR